MAARKHASSVNATEDALTLLSADHRAVQELFKRFRQIRGEHDEARCAAVVQQICDALIIHATIEEEIFYPAVQAAIEDDDLMDEAEVEHASMRDLIDQIEEMTPGDPLFAARVTVLGEYVKHHVREEEGEMFGKVRAAANAGELDLTGMAAALERRKSDLHADLEIDEDVQPKGA